MLTDGDTQWRHVDRVKTWPYKVFGPVRVLHDKSRKLVIVHIDLAVLVFDVSRPGPVFLYQRMIRDSAIRQAGNGGVLIETLEKNKDIGWVEVASLVRVLTHDGARPIPGAKISDRQLRRTRIGKDTSSRNRIIHVGDTVLVSHAGGVALFDGDQMIDRADIVDEFPNFNPHIITTKNNTYLQGGIKKMYRFTRAHNLESVTGLAGERVQWIFSGKEFEFYRYGNVGEIHDGFGNIFPLAPPTNSGGFVELVRFQHRTAMLVQFKNGYFIYEPCDMH